MEMQNSYENALHQMEAELEAANRDKRQLANAQLSMYGSGMDNDNLVKWQLNLEEEKDRIYHLLKGHRIGYDEKGNVTYLEPESQDSVMLNELGIDYIMGLLEAFLNRNIILSNFTEERIQEIMLDLGWQIIDDIFNDYERMGLDTDDKRKKFQILFWKVLLNIEAAYRRAMGGKERESLRKVMSVSQTEPLGRMQQYPVVSQQQSHRSLVKPWTWFKT